MDQKTKAFIVLGTISVIIYVLYLMTSGGENNYLNPSGNRNPANQKLMVVDQDTGEISFIQKSLQGVNAQIVEDDKAISEGIAKLRSDLNTWNGDRYREIEALAGRVSKLETDLGNINGVIDARIRNNSEKFLRHGEHVSLYMWAQNRNKWYALKDHDGQTDLGDKQDHAYWVDESWEKGRQKYARISINRMGGCPDTGAKCGWSTGGQIRVA